MTIKSNPTAKASVNNEMIYVVEDAKAFDPEAYPSYKYILDVYVGGVLKGRLKAFPDPEYKFGIFDIAPILRSSMVYEFKANYTNLFQINSPSIDYQVKIGEEYGAVTTLNIITDSVRKAFKSYAKRPFTTSDVLVPGFATNSPSQMYTYRSARWLIIPFYVESPTQSLNIYGSPTNLTSVNTFEVNCSFLKNEVEDEFISQGITSDFGNKIVTVLCNDKYSPITLAWLNPYGAYESYTFGLVNKKTIDVERKSYGRSPYWVTSGGLVSYASNGVYRGGERGINNKVTTKVNLTSHILTDGEYRWLADMFASPDVYIEIGETFYPCKITGTNYEELTYLNSGLTPLKFEVQYSDITNTQFL
jgi:hypothetical protein